MARPVKVLAASDDVRAELRASSSANAKKSSLNQDLDLK
jgi:hypothetical protein